MTKDEYVEFRAMIREAIPVIGGPVDNKIIIRPAELRRLLYVLLREIYNSGGRK